jgi:ABC-type lipoprotein release transport system permease subunit
MFFFTYLRRELRRRMRQAVVTALGLGVGIGLVITVTALSSGVRSAQGKVLGALFGVGTDITVTTATAPASGSAGLGQITPEPYVQHFDTLTSVLAALLAIAAALVAGSLGGWRISRLRPAEALARVA